MDLNPKQLKKLTLVTDGKKERLAESLLGDLMKRLLHGVTDKMESNGEENIATRVHDMRNRIADAFREKYPNQYVEFFAYNLMIGSAGKDDRHKYLDFPEPGAETVLAEVVEALEERYLDSDPDAVIDWVRQLVFSDKPRRKSKKPKGNLEE